MTTTPGTDRLVKAEGCGNDFVLGLGAWAERLRDDGGLAARLCDRRRGIGADGVLALFPEPPGRLRIVYRNADGSWGRFCGNATRCAARAAFELLDLGSTLQVVTDWAVIPAEVRGDLIALELPQPEEAARPTSLVVGDRSWSLALITIGVPHAVIRCETGIEQIDLETLGPALGHHPGIGPAGSNINLAEPLPDGRLRVRTWERGVEAETLACGSGVISSALVHLAASGRRDIECVTAGGDVLAVEVLGEPPQCPVRLIGPARLVAAVEPFEDISPS
jgi:diaminopimelate epimerase